MVKKSVLSIEYKNISEIKPYEKNPRKNDKAVDNVAKSIKEYGFKNPIILDKNNIIVAGHTRLKAAEKLKLDKVPTIKADDLSPEQIKAFRIMDNRSSDLSDWDDDLLKEELSELKNMDFDLDLTGFDFDEITKINSKLSKKEFNKNYQKTKLRDDFMFPPFSILNARTGSWQKRKSEWYTIILDKTKTRKGILGTNWMLYHINEGVSVLDPVLAELMFLWFCPEKGTIFDPFAGDTEPCIVAGVKGHNYKGIELRQQQIDHNLKIAKENDIEKNIAYYCDDGINLDRYIKPESVDFLFSCPPYYDLEKYSDLKEDLSNLSVEEFDKKYFEVIKKAVKTLKQNRFACFIVGEARDKKGEYLNLVSKTIKAFQEAGLKYYNELILVTSVGSLGLRARKPFETSRKIGKTHQNILIFKKGEIKRKKIPQITKEVMNFYSKEITNLINYCKSEGEILPNKQEILLFYKGNLEEIKNINFGEFNYESEDME